MAEQVQPSALAQKSALHTCKECGQQMFHKDRNDYRKHGINCYLFRDMLREQYFKGYRSNAVRVQ